jgi:hypothetical protein
MNDIRHRDGYYSIIAKAVRALDRNSGDARRRLYERARAALLAKMRSAENALDEADILVAQASLERAILKIEADAEPDEDAEFANAYEAIQPPPAALPRAGVVAAPGPPPHRPANHNGEHRPGPLARLWTRVIRGGGNDALGAERVAGVGASLFSHFPHDTSSAQRRDTWLTDLLARASREEDAAEDQNFAPPREIRQIR